MKTTPIIIIAAVALVLAAGYVVWQQHAQKTPREEIHPTEPATTARKPVVPVVPGQPLARQQTTPPASPQPARTRDLSPILAAPGTRPYRERLKAAENLPSTLPAVTQKELLSWLEDSAAARPDNRVDLAIKNAVLNRLMDQDERVVDLGRSLERIIRDKDADRIWRDYALQFTGLWFEKYGADRTAAGEREALRTITRASLTERDGPLCGTALIAMTHGLASGTFTIEETASAATEALDDPASCTAVRVTALQTLAGLRDAAACATARDLARQWVDEPKRPLLERLSAVATLSRVGESTDLETLSNLAAAGTDPRLRQAAQDGGERLRRKLDLEETAETEKRS